MKISLITLSKDFDILTVVDAPEKLVFLCLFHSRNVRRIRGVKAIEVRIRALMSSDISRNRNTITALASIQLNDPLNKIRVVFGFIVNVPLDKKGYFEAEIIKIHYISRVEIVLNGGDCDQGV